jgi:outer membrane murein-binding lipoprotein Lpp
MLGGVGTFGLMAGLLASALLGPRQRESDPPDQVAVASPELHAAIAALRADVAQLRQEVASLVGEQHAQYSAHDAHDQRSE